MARRGTRFSRPPGNVAGKGQHQVSATTYCTIPSGCTIAKSGSTFAGRMVGTGGVSNFFSIFVGTSPNVKIRCGSDGVTSTPDGGGSSLSNGTVQITTGLTTVNDFFYSIQIASAATPHDPRFIRYSSWEAGYINAGGVTLTLLNAAGSGCTPNAPSAPGAFSYVSIAWVAIGT